MKKKRYMNGGTVNQTMNLGTLSAPDGMGIENDTLTDEEIAYLNAGSDDSEISDEDIIQSDLNAYDPRIKTEEDQAAVEDYISRQEQVQDYTTSSDDTQKESVDDRYRKLIEKLESEYLKEDKSSDKNKWMNWLTGIGQGAAVYNKQNAQVNPTAIRDVKYWGDVVDKNRRAGSAEDLQKLKYLQNAYQGYLSAKSKGQLTPKDKAYLEHQKELLTQRQTEYKDELEEKKKTPTWKEKEAYKSKIKQDIVDKKEKSKEAKKVKESVKNIDDQIAKVKRARDLLKKLVKNTSVADTGPLDQWVTGSSNEGQLVRQAFNDLSLTKMTKMFKGMSKAIDSDAERKMFEQSQASLSNYPSTNMQILKDMEDKLKDLKAREQQYMKEISSSPAKIDQRDKQAIDFINNNPKDPRSSAIREKLIRKGIINE